MKKMMKFGAVMLAGIFAMTLCFNLTADSTAGNNAKQKGQIAPTEQQSQPHLLAARRWR